MIKKIKDKLNYLLKKSINHPDDIFANNIILNSSISDKAKLYLPHTIANSVIGDYSYIAPHGILNNTIIGKFCSIGPYLISGYGLHPIDGLSTAPMFYSTARQNGYTLCKNNKVADTKAITIGNDVFIGARVILIDGISIGDGAVIGAGAVVSSDVPPYAVVAGVPAKIIKYRFSQDIIDDLLRIRWWDFDEKELHVVEQYYNDINGFLQLFKK